MPLLLRNKGQFVPISAMVMFTIVVFMIAVVNIYKVAREKLKVQNLADAAALNLATQQAQAFNLVADKNEILNHMVDGIPSPSDETAGREFKDCSAFTAGRARLIPGISCVENTATPGGRPQGVITNRHIFYSRDGAINYAEVIYSMNQAQRLFVDAYNSFLGADPRQANMGPGNFSGLLRQDFGDALDNVRLVAWNSNDQAGKAENQLKDWNEMDEERPESSAKPFMDPMKFKVHHDVEIRYTINRGAKVRGMTLGNVLFQCSRDDVGDSDFGQCGPLHRPGVSTVPVGWMVPEPGMPSLEVKLKNGSKNRMAVGVSVSKDVKLGRLLGRKTVTATSHAYIVEGSGKIGSDDDQSRNAPPKFKPTYWVKLADRDE